MTKFSDSSFIQAYSQLLMLKECLKTKCHLTSHMQKREPCIPGLFILSIFSVSEIWSYLLNFFFTVKFIYNINKKIINLKCPICQSYS